MNYIWIIISILLVLYKVFFVHHSLLKPIAVAICSISVDLPEPEGPTK